MALEYRNLMEDIVVQNAITMMQARECCTCDACTSDVVAYALNHVPPRYVAYPQRPNAGKNQRLRITVQGRCGRRHL